ncbi:hypothetical protein tb265_46840 [Gemmatimonadetes bacterium T265]|nr:hypothetical protein tb265_46840 [Gemmatimonadetes bacterium T265]
MHIEAKLADRGLVLPPAATPPAGFDFSLKRVRGDRAYLAVHGPQWPDGTFGHVGKVGAEVKQAARTW